jgi:hypothetical protein
MGEPLAYPAATLAKTLAARGIRGMPVYIAWFGIEPSEDANIAAAFLDPDTAKIALQQALSWIVPETPHAALSWVERDGKWEAVCCGVHLHIVVRRLHVTAPPQPPALR